MTLRAGFDVPLIVLYIWCPYRLRCTEQNRTLRKSGLTDSVNKNGKIFSYRRDNIDIAKHGSEMVTSKMNVR